MRQIIVIPARYASSRLPGKPLLEILGRSVLLRTHDCCAAAFDPADIFVATDDARIAAHCAENNMQCLLTSPDCLTGTDRMAEVARDITADVYINVQGDDPLTNPADILAIAERSRAWPDSVINGMAPILSRDQYLSRAIPKVVTRPDGRLLYMSRSPIPGNKNGAFQMGWRQICIYAFPRAALEAFAAQTRKTILEQAEDIEILRFLELGYEVQMVGLSEDSISVDVPGDIARVEAAIRERQGR